MDSIALQTLQIDQHPVEFILSPSQHGEVQRGPTSPGLTRIQNLGTAAGKKVERQASGSAPSVVFPPALLRLPAPSGSSSPECERKLSASRVCVFSHCAKLHGRAEGWEELKMKGPFFSSLCSRDAVLVHACQVSCLYRTGSAHFCGLVYLILCPLWSLL